MDRRARGSAGSPEMAVKRAVPNVTCLGCGCTCDDMEVLTIDRRIVEARNACALGAAWFGDGVVPQRSSIAGRDVVVDEAIAAASQLLGRATSPLVYLAPDISSETQREAVALADALGAAVDSVTSATALEPLLAFQERGRASATLGELRNRADVIVFWGVDPALRYPRFTTRYAPDPSGLQVVDGRRSRTVIAVDIDAPGGRGPVDADRRLAIAPSDEVGVLTATAAIVAGAVRSDASSSRGDSVWRTAGELAPLLVAAHYAALVADGEAADAAGRDRARSAALIALAQALNGPTRAALCTLRAGGNRSGAVPSS